jgi:hypothetical protein
MYIDKLINPCNICCMHSENIFYGASRNIGLILQMLLFFISFC